MIVYLDYWKADKLDLKKYYETYDKPRSQYRLLQGAPLLVNVEGHYVKANDIPELIVNRNWRVLSAVNKWMMELKNPSNVSSKEVLNFRWER